MPASEFVTKNITEKDFQNQVIDAAKKAGFYIWRDNFSRRNAAGFPDLLLLKPGRSPLWVELKRADGRLHPSQTAFLALLVECGQDVRVWRPRDWDEIEAELTRR